MNLTHKQALALMEAHWNDRSMTLQDMADRMECCRGMVSWLAEKYGLPRRKRAFNRTQMRVRIRDEDYENVTAAAEALGVKENTVYSMMRKGTLDQVGTGFARHDIALKNPQCRELVIGPYRWVSIRAAARDLKVSHNTIRRMAEKNDVEGLQGLAMAYGARKAA